MPPTVPTLSSSRERCQILRAALRAPPRPDHGHTDATCLRASPRSRFGHFLSTYYVPGPLHLALSES